MKKSLLALAILASGSAYAVESNLSASGVLMGGFYTDTSGEFKNNGATGMDLFVDYNSGNWKAQYGVEMDLQDQAGDHSIEDVKFTTIDAWIGYEFSLGTLSGGLRGDSAVDAVDAYADLTVEFGNSPNDASDVGSFIKFEDTKGSFVYGISPYADRNADSSDVVGMNGYVGYRGEGIGSNFFFEINDNTSIDGVKEIVGINTVISAGSFGLGLSGALETRTDNTERASYGVTMGSNLSQKLYVAGGYHFADESRDTVNFGGKYFFTPRLTGLVDVAYHLSDEAGKQYDGEVETFVRLDYSL